MSESRPRVFITYAREDAERALQLASDLLQRGAVPWIDKWSILAGEDWEQAIRKAIEDSDFVIAVMSKRALGKRGFVQRELRWAIEVLDLRPPDSPFLIQARLDACSPTHPALSKLQWCDLFPDWEEGVSCVARALGLQGEQAQPRVEFGLDAVTGLYSSAMLALVIPMEQARVIRYGTPCSALSVDVLDHANLVRTLGSKEWDRLLVRVGAFVLSNVRRSDYVFRHTEARLVVLATQTTVEGCRALAERLLALSPVVMGSLSKGDETSAALAFKVAAIAPQTRDASPEGALEWLDTQLAGSESLAATGSTTGSCAGDGGCPAVPDG
jgi:GGDEF domain-containing protein